MMFKREFEEMKMKYEKRIQEKMMEINELEEQL